MVCMMFLADIPAPAARLAPNQLAADLAEDPGSGSQEPQVLPHLQTRLAGDVQLAEKGGATGPG